MKMKQRYDVLYETAITLSQDVRSGVTRLGRFIWGALLLATMPLLVAAAPQQANGITLDVSTAGMNLSIYNTTLKGALHALSSKADFEIIGIETVAEKPIQRAILRGQPEEVFARLLRGYSYILNYRETGGQKPVPNRLNIERLIVLGPGKVMPADGNYNMDTMAETTQTPVAVANRPPSAHAQQTTVSRGHIATTSSRVGPVAGLLAKQAVMQTLPVVQNSPGTSGANSKASAGANAGTAPVTAAGWKPGPEDMANLAKLTRTAMQGTEALVKGLEVAQRTHLEAQQR